MEFKIMSSGILNLKPPQGEFKIEQDNSAWVYFEFSTYITFLQQQHNLNSLYEELMDLNFL